MARIPPPSPWKSFGGPQAEREPFSSNYWTLSAWETAAALGQFVRASPHSEVMEELPKSLEHFRTWRWSAAGSGLPPSWDDALRRV